MEVNTRLYTYACTNIHTYRQYITMLTYLQMHTHAHARMPIYIYDYTYAHIHVYAYVYTRVQTHYLITDHICQASLRQGNVHT